MLRDALDLSIDYLVEFSSLTISHDWHCSSAASSLIPRVNKPRLVTHSSKIVTLRTIFISRRFNFLRTLGRIKRGSKASTTNRSSFPAFVGSWLSDNDWPERGNFLVAHICLPPFGLVPDKFGRN